MSVDVNLATGVKLQGDGLGGNAAITELNTVMGAYKVEMVFRYWLDTFNTDTGYLAEAAAWDNMNFFGLGFDNTRYVVPTPYATTFAPAGFFGVCQDGPGHSSTTSGTVWHPNSFFSYGIQVGSVYMRPLFTYRNNGGGYSTSLSASFSDGIGGDLGTSLNGESVPVATGKQTNMHIPQTPTYGAMFTGMWRVWGSLVDNTVYARLAINLDSYAEGDAMFDTIDNAAVSSDTGTLTIHGDTTSAWRNAGSPGTMNFPNWLKFQFTHPSQAMVLKYFKIRHFDATETIVNEEILAA